MQLRIALPFLLFLTFSQEFQSEAGTGWYGSGKSKNRLGIAGRGGGSTKRVCSLSHNAGSQFNSLHQIYMLGACSVPCTVLGARAKVMSEAKILPLWNSYSSGRETDNT